MFEGADKVTENLGLAMQGLETRSKLISNNIANAETPGYKRKYIEFEQALQGAQESLNFELREQSKFSLSATHQDHFTFEDGGGDIFSLGASVKTDQDEYMPNGNNVRLDQEMMNLTETSMKYKGISLMLKKHIQGIRGIIQG